MPTRRPDLRPFDRPRAMALRRRNPASRESAYGMPKKTFHYLKRCTACLLPLLLLLALVCPTVARAAETWAVYWYLCGSNLESEDGAASADLAELLKARLPDNVKVIIQTGGASKWHRPDISPKHISRYIYQGGKLELLARLPQASMGDEKTLTSFLAFCKEKYSADHQVFVFWDHGGGSIGGVANDENFDFDALSLKEINNSFKKVYTASAARPPFEIIGFDACLMATLDTASAVSGFARYMVASQEVEPANGWQYTAWVGALGANTAISPEALGKAICDSYLEGCEEAQTAGNATLSLIDLGKIPFLNLAYNALGLEAVSLAMDDDSFYAAYGRQAKAAENYVNSRSEGFTNMVDLGSLVRRLKTTLPEFAPHFLDSLGEAVVYKVHGPYRSPSGLSCYYPFDGGKAGFSTMMQAGNITTFLVLSGLQLGFLDTDSAVKHLERISDDITAALEREEHAPEAGAPAASAPSVPAPPAPPPSAQVQAPKPQGQGSAQSSWAPLQSGLAAMLGKEKADETSPGSVAALLGQAASAVGSFVVPLKPLDISSLEDVEVTIGNGGEARLDLGPERVKFLDSVQFYLAYYSIEDNLIMLLGKDADMEADWSQGVFKDNFQGRWAALDDHLVYLEITHQDDGINHYVVPVMLNGQRCNLIVIYDFAKKEYKILGARRVQEGEMTDKAMIRLKAGDKVTTILLAMQMDDEDGEFQEVEVDTFTLGKKITFEDTDMGDGQFMFMFEMTDVQNNTATSQIVTIEVKDGEALYSN